MDERPYYAVRRGRNPGIYRTWDEAEEQVHGYPRPRHKKYYRREDAEAFMRGENPEAVAPRLPVPFDAARVAAFHEAHRALTRPRVGYRGRTIRIPADAAVIPFLRLLRELGCPLTPKASQWLDSFER